MAAFSATDGFASGLLVHISTAAPEVEDPVDHVGLVHHVFAQRRIIEELTGSDPGSGAISTDLALSTLQSGLALADVDFALALLTPVDTADTRSFYALKASGDVTFVGLPGGAVLSGTEITIEVNGSADSAGPPPPVVDFPASFGSADGLVVDAGGQTIKLDFAERLLQARGTVALTVPGAAMLSGQFVFRSTTENLTLGGITADFNVIEIGAAGASAFVGVNGPASNANAVGLSATNAALGLALFRPAAGGASSFALKATAEDLSTVGTPGLPQLSASELLVRVNRTAGAVALRTIAGVDLEFTSAESNLTLVQAQLDIDVAGFVSLSGNVTLEFGSLASVVLDTLTQQASETLSGASLIAIGVTNATGFVGINEGEPGETGVAVTIDELALALIQPAGTTDTRYWVGVQGRVSQATFSSPTPAIEIGASTLTLALNQRATDGTFVDFTQIDRDGQGGADGGLTITTGPASTETLTFNAPVTQATGQISIDVAGFVRLSGAFTFEQRTLASVRLSDGTSTSTLSNAQLLIVGASNVSGFVGLNAGTPGALGFSVDVDEFALVVIQPADAADTRQWLALEASVSSAMFVGLGDTLELSASNLTIAINTTDSSDGTFVDFSASSAVSVDTGTSTRTLDFDRPLIRATGQATIDVAGFVRIEGQFAFEKTTLATVELRDAAGTAIPDLTNAQLLTVGASDVTGFVGLNAGEPSAVGFEVTVDEFALAVVRPADGTDTRQWVALGASVSEADFVGLGSDFVLSATTLEVEINASAADGSSIDFDQTGGVVVTTGLSSTRTIDFDRPLIRAAGQVTIDLAGFLRIAGNFAFEKSTLASVVVVDPAQNETTLANARLLSVGASNVTGFVGLNAGQPGAVGLSVTVDEFALAMVRPADPGDPTSGLSNLSDGATYFTGKPDSPENINNPANETLYDPAVSGTNGRYFDLVLTPTTGAARPDVATSADPDRVDPADLRVRVFQIEALGHAITGATTTAPVRITTAADHGLATGDRVTITGIAGNTAANGTFIVTVVDGDEFTLDGSVGDGTYTDGGEWRGHTELASPITITSVEAVPDAAGADGVSGSSRPSFVYRFFYNGDFVVAGESAPLHVVFEMDAGAWQDGAGNASAALSEAITVREPASAFFISLEGGLTLEAAGLLPDPIFQVRGFVDFEARTVDDGVNVGHRFELDFGGTFKVIYLGNIASVAGRIVLDTSKPEIGRFPTAGPLDLATAASFVSDLNNGTLPADIADEGGPGWRGGQLHAPAHPPARRCRRPADGGHGDAPRRCWNPALRRCPAVPGGE